MPAAMATLLIKVADKTEAATRVCHFALFEIMLTVCAKPAPRRPERRRKH
jgi:hypothetical protein